MKCGRDGPIIQNNRAWVRLVSISRVTILVLFAIYVYKGNNKAHLFNRLWRIKRPAAERDLEFLVFEGNCRYDSELEQKHLLACAVMNTFQMHDNIGQKCDKTI